MSRHEYEASRAIEAAMYEQDWPFYGLIMAAMRRADTDNLKRLRTAFPHVWADLQARYNAPGGVLAHDET